MSSPRINKTTATAATKAVKSMATGTKTLTAKQPSVGSPPKLRWLDAAVAIVSVGLVGYGLWQLTGQNPSAERPLCVEIGQEHQISLANDVFVPAAITVSRCDRLVISNQGTEAYDLAFGIHEEHVEYPGFERQILRSREYFTLDATKSGSYPLHDHYRDKAKLQLTITE